VLFNGDRETGPRLFVLTLSASDPAVGGVDVSARDIVIRCRQDAFRFAEHQLSAEQLRQRPGCIPQAL
jgi:hypothetical protein